MADDERARRERADHLRQEIAAFKRAQRRPPRSPREFADEEARRAHEGQERDTDTEPSDGDDGDGSRV